MQCPNCDFFNLPTLRRCARCESSLTFDTVAVEPPRAGDSLVARMARVQQFRLSMLVSYLGGRLPLSATRELLSQCDVPTLLRCIVPGWGQLYQGRRLQAQFIFGGWIAMLVLSLLFVAEPPGTIFGLGALGIHSFSLGLITAPWFAHRYMSTRVGYSLAGYALLICLLYAPTVMLLSTIVRPVRLIVPAQLEWPIRNHDVVLVEGTALRSLPYERGELVLFRITQQAIAGVYLQEGHAVDRIIGVAGDQFEIRGQTWLLNGTPLTANELPLLGKLDLPDQGMTVPDNHYLVIPSTVLHPQRQRITKDAVNTLTSLTCFPTSEDITGRILVRWKPFSRMAFGDDILKPPTPPQPATQGTP